MIVDSFHLVCLATSYIFTTPTKKTIGEGSQIIFDTPFFFDWQGRVDGLVLSLGVGVKWVYLQIQVGTLLIGAILHDQT